MICINELQNAVIYWNDCTRKTVFVTANIKFIAFFNPRMNNEGQVNIKIERSKKKTFKSNIFKVHSHCFKPTPPNETFNNFSMIIECDDLAFHQGTDQIWAVCSKIPKSDSNIKVPTWSSYNLLMFGKPEQTICQSLHLLPGTPTDWSNLYTTLKLVQGINVSVPGHAKTIVSLDLQLYAKCMQ